MSRQFFRVSGQTNSSVVIFVCLFVCQVLVNGISEYRYKCDTVTKTRPDFCWGVVHCESSGVLYRHCWAVVEVWLIQSLKQGQFQSGIGLLQVVWSWSVCSMRGHCWLSPSQSLPGDCAIQWVEEGISGDMTSLLVVWTHLEHKDLEDWTAKTAEGTHFESPDVSLQMRFGTGQCKCNAHGRECNLNFLYTRMKSGLTFYSGKDHTTQIIPWKNKLCAQKWLRKEGEA